MKKNIEKSIRIFNNGVAIVTGAATGIGRSLSIELAKRNCELILADLQIDIIEKLANDIKKAGGKATAYQVDVTNYENLENVVLNTMDKQKRLDYIFNNVGIGIGGGVRHYSIEDWRHIINVNVCGVINGVHAVINPMIKQGFGHIVNTSSIAGLAPWPSLSPVAYTMSKHALVGLSISLRAEAALSGIRVSVLCPGLVNTPILEGGGKYGKMLIDIPKDKLEKRIQKYRPISPDVFAYKALNAVAKNKAIIIIPSRWKLYWWIYKLFPSMSIFLAYNDKRGHLKDTPKSLQNI